MDLITIKMTDCKEKEAPLEADIIFKTSVGNYYAGKRFLPTSRSSPIYQDYRGSKIRKNVVSWGFMP